MSKFVNGCPRCNGVMVKQSDSFSSYITCLICGYVSEPERLSLAVARAEAEEGGSGGLAEWRGRRRARAS